jgi:hypothetical protein
MRATSFLLALVTAAVPAVAAAQNRAPAPAGQTGPSMRIAAFATAGWFSATATKSFDAILDKHAGVDVGAGAQVAWQRGKLRGLFAEVGVSRFEETGERVFIDRGEIFKLGIPLTISLTPIEVTGGYRIAPVRRRGGRVNVLPVAYFAGGGVGTLSYKEADDDGDISERFTTYHVMGGADATFWKGLLVGGEVRYRWVPDGLGAGGVSDEFNETDLGGFTVRARIGFAF